MPIDQAKRLARLRHQREPNRMSVRVLRLLDKRPNGMTNSELWNVLYPGKEDRCEDGRGGKTSIIGALMGRVAKSFMGTLVTKEVTKERKVWVDPRRKTVWSITEDGREYLRVYDEDPQRIIDGERESRLWLQENGRRFNTPESIGKRAERDASIELELQIMRDACVSFGSRDSRTLDIERVYMETIYPVGRHCYRVMAGGRRSLRV